MKSRQAHTVADNEGKCCDAVLQILKDEFGAPPRNISPDTPTARDVDVVCMIGDRRVALEHTRVDPYPDRVPNDILLAAFMEPIIQRLDADPRIPGNASFQIVLETAALSRTRKAQHGPMQEALIDWVAATANRIDSPRQGRFNEVRAQVPGLPFAVTLQRMMRLSRKITFARFQPEDLEGKRAERIGKALHDKLPKLATHQRRGSFTVLVLEDDDIALSNCGLIAEAVHRMLPTIGVEAPNGIYVVETMIATLWTACELKFEARLWPEDATAPRYREFDPSRLTDILHVKPCHT